MFKHLGTAAAVLATSLTLTAAPAMAADHYVWSNRDFRFWIDDTMIEGNVDGTCAVIDGLVCEDLHRGTATRAEHEPFIFHLDRGRWLCTIGDVTKPVDYYSGWWQPYGLQWLQANGYLGR